MIKNLIKEELSNPKILINIESPRSYKSFTKVSPGLTKKIKSLLKEYDTQDSEIKSTIQGFLDGSYKMSIELVVDGAYASIKMQGSVVVVAADDVLSFERKLL